MTNAIAAAAIAQISEASTRKPVLIDEVSNGTCSDIGFSYMK